MFFQYHMNCKHINDNSGDNEIIFMYQFSESFLSEMVLFDDDGRDFKLDLPSLSQ